MLGEIFELAHKISTEKRSTVFAHYMGHVNKLEVSVFVDGWFSGAEANPYMDIRLDNDSAHDNLEYCLSTLQDIYDNASVVVKVTECKLCYRAIMSDDHYLMHEGKAVCSTCLDRIKAATCEREK